MDPRKFIITAVLLLLAPIAVTAQPEDEGFINLDDSTFSKVVNGRDNVLVRFDKEFSYGDAHEAFKWVALAAAASEARLVVASVNISNNKASPTNQAIAKRFGLCDLPDESFPKYKLFLKGGDVSRPVSFHGVEPTQVAITDWLNFNGVFVGKKGQVPELIPIARRYFETVDTNAKGLSVLIKEAREVVAGIRGRLDEQHREYADYYVEMMEKGAEKGDKAEDFFDMEYQRMLDASRTAGAKAPEVDALEWRMAVLDSFEQPQPDYEPLDFEWADAPSAEGGEEGAGAGGDDHFGDSEADRDEDEYEDLEDDEKTEL